MRNNTLTTVAVAVAVAAFALPTVAQAEPHEFTVTMGNMSYGKLPTGAKVGDAIVWVNQDTVEHSATAKDGSFDIRLLPGKRGRTILKAAGNLAIYCVMHPMMRGTLKVGA